MKIITEPTVTLVTSPRFHTHPSYAIPDDGSSAVRLGAFAAKGCYDSYGEGGRPNAENQQAILEHRHGSVLEHLNFGVFIEGITRGCSLELNRHRFFAISQRSTRYTKEEDAAIVLDPYYASLYHKLRGDKEEFEYWNTDSHYATATDEEWLLSKHILAAEEALGAYEVDVDRLVALNPNNLTGFDLRKWARGKARNLLPHALETRGTYTANLRGWRWFIESRSDRHAEAEIRRLAGAVYDCLMQSDAAFYLQDYYPVTEDGLREFQTDYRKV